MTRESCIYEGTVWHRRLAPPEHSFRYRLFMMYLDLDELPRVFERRWLWSAHRRAVARFCREDHLGDPRVPLDRSVRDLVEQYGGTRPTGPIRLLTHLRYFGYVFNPLSVFYCFDPEGRRVESCVAEVSNTPWNERHAYVLRPTRGSSSLCETEKTFHVSPFLDMDQRHVWDLGEPGRRLSVGIRNVAADGKQVFEARLALSRRELTRTALAAALVRYPLMTMQVIAAIYWEAFRLRRKHAPVYPHPRERETVS